MDIYETVIHKAPSGRVHIVTTNTTNICSFLEINEKVINGVWKTTHSAQESLHLNKPLYKML